MLPVDGLESGAEWALGAGAITALGWWLKRSLKREFIAGVDDVVAPLKADVATLSTDVQHLHECFETKDAERQDDIAILVETQRQTASAIEEIKSTRIDLAAAAMEQVTRNEADHVSLAMKLADVIDKKDESTKRLHARLDEIASQTKSRS